MRPPRFPTLAAPLAALALVLTSAAAEAQYFGQNKVQYRDFDFDILKTEHFDIYYYPEERTAVEHAARLAERWYARLSKVLSHKFEDRQAVILYASHPHFEQTNVIEGELGEGTGGVTESLKRRIILPFAGPLAETDHVLGHELVHAFQYDIGGIKGNVQAPVSRLPLWFIEGMAEYLSVGPVDPHTALWMREAARRDKLPKISDLNSPRYFPYRYGQALWSYIGGRYGDDKVAKILRAATGRTGGAVISIEKVLDVKEDQLSKDWHASIKAAYQEVAAKAKPASEYGRALITEKGGGRLNVAPALSPDGKYLAFLSEKGLFSIELYVADAQTGKILRKLTKTAVDPHFESLQFINSAGAWDKESRRFAFPGISKGRAVLTLVEMPKGKDKEEIKLRDVDEAFHPTFSPDGRKIAFTGLAGGLTDLFVYDLDARKLTRLTDDAYADLQPSWSPDGTRIAFVTDRFSSDLANESFGNYRLASLDPGTNAIEALPSFPDAKNINPQWGPDPGELYFLSDRGGVTNVYRLDTKAGETRAVTNLILGATGITALSPSLTVATNVRRLAFTEYEEEGYRIYMVDDAKRLAGEPMPEISQQAAAVLPPVERRSSETDVVELLSQDAFGLPEPARFKDSNYRPGLSLDYVAQPYLAVGADRFGTFVGGGTTLWFSDMLGEHSLTATVQANGRFDLNSFLIGAGYTNRKSRLNWGAVVEQIPVITGSFRSGTTFRDGQELFAEETDRFRETHRIAAAVLNYPFNRAKRIELSAAFRNISFSAERITDLFSPVEPFEFVGQEKTDLEASSSLNLAEMTAAFVHDTSIFGATSPILGQRYRFEVSPTTGTITYTGILADYRAYLMPARPFTFAFRALHYGRYGKGAEDERFVPLFLGYPNLVRGYDIDTFEVRECGDSEGCPIFTQLEGSRLLVGNAEIRFPLLGLFGGSGYYGPLPIEMAFFADTGVAWTRAEKPSFLSGGSRDFVSSVGAALRINVLGFLIAEIDLVRPLSRPNKREWIWTFGFSPGF